MPAVVETVLTGSTLKIVTLPERAVLTLAVAGAQSPNVRRMPDGTLEGDPFGREVRSEPFIVNHDSRCTELAVFKGTQNYCTVPILCTVTAGYSETLYCFNPDYSGEVKSPRYRITRRIIRTIFTGQIGAD